MFLSRFSPEATAAQPGYRRSVFARLKQPALPELVIPDDHLLDVSVVEIISPSVVRVRLFGPDYDDALFLLTQKVRSNLNMVYCERVT